MRNASPASTRGGKGKKENGEGASPGDEYGFMSLARFSVLLCLTASTPIMKFRFPFIALATLFTAALGSAEELATLTDVSTEHAKLIRTSRHGGIPPLVGVHSMEIYHATHERSANTLEKGYTYNHHVDGDLERVVLCRVDQWRA